MFPEYNTEYAIGEFKLHGEYQLLSKLSPFKFKTIFDVGCNIGEWTRMCRIHHPNASIHMFEIAYKTFNKMIRNDVLDINMYPNNFGLSSSFRDIPLQYVSDNDRVSTTVPDILHDNTVKTFGLVVPGSVYANIHNITHIDYLKIDTEGHEYEVLEGFRPMLEQGNITCLQFEYGYISILTKKLLIDYYKMLNAYGYVLGKLTPEGVRFKDYHLFDEDFRGPDYVAVHKSRSDIIDVLK
jgi:FkbM family methyltransferase